MGDGFDRELQILPTEAGCSFVREGKGSHAIWYGPITCRTFAMPRGTKSRHTANNVLKDAGLPKAF